jgi:hypothetical protein
MGLDWLVGGPSASAFGHGLAVKDIERLDDLAGPRWSRQKLFGILRPSMLG